MSDEDLRPFRRSKPKAEKDKLNRVAMLMNAIATGEISGLLEVPLPNGKTLGESTLSECVAIGRWLKEAGLWEERT